MVLLSPPSAKQSASSWIVELRVCGIPAPQGSKVSTRYGGLRESSKNVGPWRSEVAYEARRSYKGPVITEAVEAVIDFYFPRAKSHFSTAKGREHELKPSAPMHCTNTLKGDLDKLIRSTLDALAVRTGGSVISDDSLVVALRCRKLYASVNNPPGALVRIREAS